VVRALEVVEITGAAVRRLDADHRYWCPAVQIGLELPPGRAGHPDHPARRPDVGAGLVDEVRRLEREGCARGRRRAARSGYAQVLRHLAGECTEEEAREETVRATRRFARRQDSWFRPDPRVRWVPAGRPRELADRIVGHLRGWPNCPIRDRDVLTDERPTPTGATMRQRAGT
jgi:tRNA dimethylallyltransferase